MFGYAKQVSLFVGLKRNGVIYKLFVINYQCILKNIFCIFKRPSHFAYIFRHRWESPFIKCYKKLFSFHLRAAKKIMVCHKHVFNNKCNKLTKYHPENCFLFFKWSYAIIKLYLLVFYNGCILVIFELL